MFSVALFSFYTYVRMYICAYKIYKRSALQTIYNHEFYPWERRLKCCPNYILQLSGLEASNLTPCSEGNILGTSVKSHTM